MGQLVYDASNVQEDSAMVVKRIGPLSVGKICFAMYAVIGLLAGLFFASVGFLWSSRLTASNPDNTWLPSMLGQFMGIGAIILFPIFYGVIGFVGGVIFAAIYNLVARMMGGIEVEIS
jgi:membrane protein insertase Oxa1/YidC/SpoIIIJ